MRVWNEASCEMCFLYPISTCPVCSEDSFGISGSDKYHPNLIRTLSKEDGSKREPQIFLPDTLKLPNQAEHSVPILSNELYKHNSYTYYYLFYISHNIRFLPITEFNIQHVPLHTFYAIKSHPLIFLQLTNFISYLI